MTWRCITTHRKAKHRSGFAITRSRTELIHYAGGKHALTGPRGAAILRDIAERWNAAGYDTSDPSPRCRADYATEAARQRFTQGIS